MAIDEGPSPTLALSGGRIKGNVESQLKMAFNLGLQEFKGDNEQNTTFR